MIELSVIGTVRQVVTVVPPYVRLYGTAGTRVYQTVSIVPQEGFAFKILKTQARDGRNIEFSLREEQNGGQVSYRLTVENRKAEEGQYTDRIEMTTDSRQKPRIDINVHGRIGAAADVKKN